MGSRGSFRSIFALEEHDSSQVDPCAAGKGPQFVLEFASVAGFVVTGVEAELEDGGLDVVSFVLLLLGNVFHQLSGAHRFHLLGQEVPPLVLGPLARIGNAERSAPCPLGLHTHQNGVDEVAKLSEALQDSLGVAPVHGLLRVLLYPRLGLLPKGRVQAAHILPNLLKKGLVDKLIAGIPGDVAADELAVHPDRLAGDLELRGLELRQTAEAGLHQVLASGIGIVTDAAAKQVVGVYRRGFVLKADKTERPAGQQVVVALLNKVLVGATEALLEDVHRHYLADGCRGGAHVARLEQRLEDGLVYLGRDQLIEPVEPGLRVFVLLHSPLPHQVGRVVKQGHLGVRVGLSEHCNSLSNMYAN